MSETAQPEKKGVNGVVFVVGFVLFCLVVAAGTLVTTIVAQNNAPDVDAPPPEIGHELVPRRE